MLARRLCSIGIAPSARLRRAVPTRGRRSLAGASWCPWGYPPRCVARRLASRSEGERGAVAPLSHFPPGHAGSEPKVRHHCFCALGSTPTAQNHGDMERRSPTGIARERETRTNNAAPLNRGDMERRSPTGIARERETRTNNAAPYRREWRTPCSIRTALFAALRAAVPAPTGRTGQRSAFPCLRALVPVLARRDCAVRPPAAGCADQRSAFPCRRVMVPVGVSAEMRPGGPPFTLSPRSRGQRTEFVAIVFARSAVRQPRRITGTWSAGLRPASRGSAKPAPTTPPPIARERETRVDDAGPASARPPFFMRAGCVSCGRGERADPIMGVSPGGGRHRPPAAGGSAYGRLAGCPRAFGPPLRRCTIRPPCPDP